MACPTCDHTLECFGVVEDMRLFHCPRCGTVKAGESVYVPKLVERCREFAQFGLAHPQDSEFHWKRLGIAESINLPEARG